VGAGHSHGAPIGVVAGRDSADQSAGQSPGQSPAAADKAVRRRLTLALALTAALFAVELAAALTTSSLALLSDAGHMATDVVALGLALAAVFAAARSRPSGSRTFGLYRLEVLAALANAALLLAVAGYVGWEAVGRFGDPVEVPGAPMVAVALAGLATNGVAYLLLRPHRGGMAARAAAMEVAADAVGSVAVLVAGALVALTGWRWADPVAGLAVAVWVLPRALRLAAQSLRVLVQAAPAHLDPETLRAELAELPGVVDVHDVHVWTLTPHREVATAHLVVQSADQVHATLDRARSLLAERHGIGHATVQVEPIGCAGCEADCGDAEWCAGGAEPR
jgi:cobalt-zinc-cadmium efflux system protein